MSTVLIAGSLIASTALCGAPASTAPIGQQITSMRCLVSHVQPAEVGRGLTESTRHKARDLVFCAFSHFACGRPFTYWMPSFPSRGENIAYGYGHLGSARSIFRAWMASPEHREILLRPWERFGVAVHRSNGFQFWVAQFGTEFPNAQ